jgi:phage tail-like protein
MAAAGRQVIVRFGGQVLMTSTLGGSTFTIGRVPDNSLPLPDTSVSPTHAEISIVSGRAMLTDLASETGTMVGGVRLLPNQPHPLIDGTQIRIGPYEIVYRSQIDVPASDTTVSSGTDLGVELQPADEPDAPVPFAARTRETKPNGFGANSRYLPYLPVIFHENDFLTRFLQIFEAIWEPLEQRQDHIAMFFSPRTCPASWLPWYASWFDLKLESHLPEARVRALLAETIDIYRWRGTAYGLTRVIEVTLGLHAEITERPSEPNVFRVAVRLPRNAGPDVIAVLHGLLNAHKPAHTGYVIEVQR